MTERLQRVFFHIGLHKTATSWLQDQLFPSLEGIKLVRTRNLARVVSHIRNGSSDTLVVSHEGMSGKLSDKRAPGDSARRLDQTLHAIAFEVPQAALIVGFREQTAWINSAFAQRAKKSGQHLENYLQGFSLDELSWCRVLHRIELSVASVFPFLHEELDHDARALIEDLCSFLGTTPPANLQAILTRRVNQSPRSTAGRRVSRTLDRFSDVLARVANPTVDGVSLAKRLRQRSGNLAAKLDAWFPPEPRLSFDAITAKRLREDWLSLLKLAGERRGRDFSALLRIISILINSDVLTWLLSPYACDILSCAS